MLTTGIVNVATNVFFALGDFSAGGVNIAQVRKVVFQIENADSDNVNADARFSLLSAVAVPEPTTLAMFGFGALGLVVAARRRRQVAAV